MSGMIYGIIGGSGFYGISDWTLGEPVSVETPFGSPSDLYTPIHHQGHTFYFLPRHGRHHTILPFEINHRANIYGMKALGAETILSFSAVGSLREDMRPCDIVLPDQYFDRTKSPERHTFFGDGIAAHISFGNPVCSPLRRHMFTTIRDIMETVPAESKRRVFNRGTYVNMAGPAFSTKAESYTYRKLGFDIIGMTSLAEAKLAREAEICYTCVAMVTDYDCWHDEQDNVSAALVAQNMEHNKSIAMEILRRFVDAPPFYPDCSCHSALNGSIHTHPEAITQKQREALRPIIGKYLP